MLGLSLPEDGVTIDLTPLGCRTSRSRSSRRLDPGRALLGALDAATQEHGLATTAGNASTPGSAA